jgi:hypothetical protein
MAGLNQRQAPVDDARSWRLRSDSKRISKDKVADAGSERCDVRVDVQSGSGASELRLAGLGSRAGGQDSGSAVGLEAADSRVGGRVGCRDGRGAVRNAASGRVGHGDSVDAVDGRGDVDCGVIDFGVLGESAHEEREKEGDDLLEGTHLDWVCSGSGVEGLRRSVC